MHLVTTSACHAFTHVCGQGAATLGQACSLPKAGPDVALPAQPASAAHQPAQRLAAEPSATLGQLQLLPRLYSKSRDAWVYGYRAVQAGSIVMFVSTLKRKVAAVPCLGLVLQPLDAEHSLWLQSGDCDPQLHDSERSASDAACALWAESRGAACTRSADAVPDSAGEPQVGLQHPAAAHSGRLAARAG